MDFIWAIEHYIRACTHGTLTECTSIDCRGWFSWGIVKEKLCEKRRDRGEAASKSRFWIISSIHQCRGWFFQQSKIILTETRRVIASAPYKHRQRIPFLLFSLMPASMESEVVWTCKDMLFRVFRLCIVTFVGIGLCLIFGRLANFRRTGDRNCMFVNMSF